MYMSRIRVATERLDRAKLMSLLSGEAYGNHQLLWQLFSDEQKRVFLFRQEMEQDQLCAGESPRGLPLFYVLSELEPVPVPGLLEVQTKPFSPNLKTGDVLAFRLRANPTISRKASTGRSLRHDVLMDAKTRCKKDGISDPEAIRNAMDEAAIEWLVSRSGNSGFELESAPRISGYRQHVNRRKNKEIRFSSIDYEGVLRVTDEGRFRETLFSGLGRSKAFGCGMLMVRRC